MRVVEILEVLKGQVLAGLNGVKVFWTMTEWRVQPLKQRAHLLCDYTWAEDLTHEVAKDLKADVAEEQVVGLVGARTIVVTRSTVEAFLVSYHPDLVSSLFPVFISFYSCLVPPLIARALS